MHVRVSLLAMCCVCRRACDILCLRADVAVVLVRVLPFSSLSVLVMQGGAHRGVVLCWVRCIRDNFIYLGFPYSVSAWEFVCTEFFVHVVRALGAGRDGCGGGNNLR